MKIKTIFFFLIFVHAAFAASPYEASLKKGIFPKEWITIPERETTASSGAQTPKEGMALENILKLHSNVLESTPLMANASSRGWYFGAFIFDLAVSIQGLVGVMVAKGDAAGSVYWWRDNKKKQNIPPVHEFEKNYLSFSDDTPWKVVEKRVEPILAGIMKAQKIEDAAFLRQNLLKFTRDFYDLMNGMSIQTDAFWWISRSALEFSVDAKGRILSPLTIGGGVKLRFEWLPNQAFAKKSEKQYVARSEQAKKLREFLKSMAFNLESIPLDSFKDTGFELAELRHGLGFFGEAELGIVKAAAEVSVQIYFAPIEDKRLKKRRNSDIVHPIDPDVEKDFNLIVLGSHPEYSKYADIHQISYKTVGLRNAPADADEATVYKVSKEEFRKGLMKAAEIAKYLGSSASNGQESKWRIYQMKSKYELSIAGWVGIVTLGGSGSIEMIMRSM